VPQYHIFYKVRSACLKKLSRREEPIKQNLPFGRLASATARVRGIFQQKNIRAPEREILFYRFFPTRLREMMSLFEYFFGFRDFWPLPVGLP